MDYNIKILFLARFGVIDGNTKTVDQRQFLLHGIRTMHTFILLYIVAVAPCLPDQMTSVGCRIDQNIIRFRLHTAFDDCFQEFIFNLKLLERKIIHINNELIISVFHRCNDIRQILELMLVNLDHTQALVIKLIDNGFDTG